MVVAAGLRNRPVALEKPTVAVSGEPRPTFTEVCNTWAQIEATGGSERLRGRQMDATSTHFISVPYRADINAGWRLRDLCVGGLTYNVVTAYDPTGMWETTVMECKVQR